MVVNSKILYFVAIFLLILIVIGCEGPEKKVIELKFNDGADQSFTIQRTRKLTTQARVIITGVIDCDIEIEITGLKPIILSAGLVKYDKWREWYTDPYQIVVHGPECTQESKLKMEFIFVHDLI